MPATAGRVRMPANNRVHSSAALQTHSIWQSAIGYDPYAPNKVNKSNKVIKPNSVNKEADNKGAQQADPSSDPDAENAYNSFQGLLALARVTNSNADEARGCCKMCGRVGHLKFQCRNFLSIKDDKDKDLEAIEAAVIAGLDKVKGNRGKGKGKGKGRDGVESSEESSEEEESESSDSDYDSEIERAIAKNKKYGKNVSSLLKSSSRKKKDGSDDEVSDREGRKKRGRSRKRRSGKKGDSESDIEDERRHGRRGSRRDKRRRRSHREAEGSGSPEGSDRRHERSSRRAAEDYNVSSVEDSRVGRDGKKLSGKESRKQR